MWRAQRILVGTDFSQTANHAVEVAFALARRTRAKLELLHAIDPAPQPLTGYEVLDELLTRRGDPVELRAHARRELEKLAQSAGPPGASLHVVHGDPASELLSRRVMQQADLLVLGAAGLRGLRRFLLGSVADRVLRRPGCPLLLVKDPPPGGEFKKILVGVELPDVSSPWLRIALSLAHDLRAEVALLHVLPARGYVSDVRHVELDPRSVPERLERLLATVERTVPAQITVRRGDPGTLIPWVAKRLQADLVVLGAERNPDGWPGRVADRVARAGLPSLLYAWPEDESTEDYEGDGGASA